MNIVGVSINMISLVALLMAIGLIMDDSIVIAENIAKSRIRGGGDAVAKGVLEVMPGVVSSFLTTACVFGPLMFLSGQIGAILKVIPIVLVITLAASLVEAFLVLPEPHEPCARQRPPEVTCSSSRHPHAGAPQGWIRPAGNITPDALAVCDPWALSSPSWCSASA